MWNVSQRSWGASSVIYPFQRISDAGILLVWLSTFLNLTFIFGTKYINDWQLPLVVNWLWITSLYQMIYYYITVQQLFIISLHETVKTRSNICDNYTYWHLLLITMSGKLLSRLEYTHIHTKLAPRAK